MSKTIPIYGGEAIVDDEDFDRLSQINWYKDKSDGNRLDNRKCNLREATHRINALNRLKSKLCKTGYKGVFPLRGKYQASIRNDGIIHYLGVFQDPALAALAYNRAAVQFHGDFARLNAVC